MNSLNVGQPLLDHLFHLGAVAVPIGDGHVEGVVDARLRLRPFEPGVVGVFERLLAVRNGEVDDGGDAAAGRRPGAGVPVVAGDGAAERQFQVDVDVEPPGMTYLPAASRTLAPSAAAARPLPTAAIFSPRTATSAFSWPSALTTVPLAMMRS